MTIKSTAYTRQICVQDIKGGHDMHEGDTDHL